MLMHWVDRESGVSGGLYDAWEVDDVFLDLSAH